MEGEKSKMKGEKANPTVYYKKPERVFVIDLEHSSGYMRRFPGRPADSTTGDIIGIGAAVVRFDLEAKEFQVVDTFKRRLYRPTADGEEKPSEEELHLWDRTIMGDNCYKFVWSKEIEALESITQHNVEGTDRLEEEINAVKDLRIFIGENETAAVVAGERLRKVGDCVSFDYGVIDQMTWEHIPDTKGLCFTVNGADWGGSIRCTTSQEDLILALVDNHWFRRKSTKEERDAGLADGTDHLRMLYGVPEFPVKHDHNPENDAIHIACRYLMMQAIADGVFVLNEDLVEKPPSGSKRPYYDFDQAVKKPRT